MQFRRPRVRTVGAAITWPDGRRDGSASCRRSIFVRGDADRLPPGDRVYLVFSDDILLVPPEALIPCGWNIEYCQTESHWLDLAIVSRCDHFIISPSTFSWWGAWMANNPAKVVVTPKPWFGPKQGLDARDIVPAGWHQLAC